MSENSAVEMNFTYAVPPYSRDEISTTHAKAIHRDKQRYKSEEKDLFSKFVVDAKTMPLLKVHSPHNYVSIFLLFSTWCSGWRKSLLLFTPNKYRGVPGSQGNTHLFCGQQSPNKC